MHEELTSLEDMRGGLVSVVRGHLGKGRCKCVCLRSLGWWVGGEMQIMTETENE